ncbi:polysaccharide deacetylase [Halalkalibacillus sediminis]|uniref:Polysaccharide deacetylase n=2 Tax=Halalkalibacillus sediminis TaxID=2018042 RepID=A0A2I0QYF6_9BACI|nr:polysaccharide deacetylase [Halalkalibacillus sediminis]
MVACSSESEPSEDELLAEEQEKNENNESEKGEDNDDTTQDEPETDEDKSDEQESGSEENESTKEDDVSNEEDDSTEVVEENKEPQYQMTDHWSFKPINDAPSEVVLLTIDDAPDKYALQMAETLKELNAPAIFFVNGIFMESEEKKDIIRQIHEMGFPIGNHTYGHTNLSNISEEEQKEEILSLSKLIEEVTGEKPKYFRAPHGVNTDFAKQLVADEGMLLMNWSYGYDFTQGYMEKEALAEIMVETQHLLNGANLLMHDREWTKDALEDIVNGLRDKGFEMLNPALIEGPNQ